MNDGNVDGMKNSSPLVAMNPRCAAEGQGQRVFPVRPWHRSAMQKASSALVGELWVFFFRILSVRIMQSISRCVTI